MDMQLAARDLVPSGEPPGAGIARVSPEPTALACLLEYAPGAQVALPIHTGIELIEQPDILPVPGMPAFCAGLVSWHGRQLPLVNLQAYLREEGRDRSAQHFSHVLVVAYQAAPGQPIEYGALCAPFLVRMVQVTDSQQCALPAGDAPWARIAISCFLQQDRVVPVLDAARIFSTRPD